jgi:hypothetical protein
MPFPVLNDPRGTGVASAVRQENWALQEDYLIDCFSNIRILPMQYAPGRARFTTRSAGGGRMAKTNVSRNSDRDESTRTEKRLIALVWMIACAIVFLLMRR